MTTKKLINTYSYLTGARIIKTRSGYYKIMFLYDPPEVFQDLNDLLQFIKYNLLELSIIDNINYMEV